MKPQDFDGEGAARRHRFGPEFLPVAQEAAARGYAPTFICESAGTQAEDAVTMMECYKKEITL